MDKEHSLESASKHTLEKLPFRIYRLASDIDKTDYVHLEFPRTGGRSSGSCTMQVSVATQVSKLREAVLNGGGSWPFFDAMGKEIASPIDQLPKEAGLLTASPGWKQSGGEPLFVLPNMSIGQSNMMTVIDPAFADKCLAKSASGDLGQWQANVAKPALGSATVTLAIMTAMSSILLPSSSLTESFILNFAGNGSSGKSTANRVAASVWGHPKDIASWYGSPRSLDEKASSNNHLCLVLDDGELADKTPAKRIAVLNELTHVLASGRSREYSRVVSGANQLPTLRFETIVLASTPVSVEQDAQARGQSRTDGDRARLLEIPVAHGNVGGIWLPIDGSATPQNTGEISNGLAAAARLYHGTAGPEFARYLVLNQAEIAKHVEKYRAKFRRHLKRALSSVEGRIADKIALVYAAGRLGIKSTVLPWPKRQVLEVCIWSFSAVIGASGLDSFIPKSAALSLTVLLNDREKVPMLGKQNITDFKWTDQLHGLADTTSNRVYVKMDAVIDTVGRSHSRLLSQSDQKALFEYLVSEKALLPGHSGGPTQSVRIGGKKPKMLVFDMQRATLLLDANKTKIPPE